MHPNFISKDTHPNALNVYHINAFHQLWREIELENSFFFLLAVHLHFIAPTFNSRQAFAFIRSQYQYQLEKREGGVRSQLMNIEQY